MTEFIFGIVAGIALDQANNRGWLKLAYDKGVALWKARGAK
jgi:hypothetical protein